MNAAWVVWTILGGRDIQTLLTGRKKFELYTLSGNGDTNFYDFLQLPTAISSSRAIPSANASVPYEPPG